MQPLPVRCYSPVDLLRPGRLHVVDLTLVIPVPLRLLLVPRTPDGDCPLFVTLQLHYPHNAHYLRLPDLFIDVDFSVC